MVGNYSAARGTPQQRLAEAMRMCKLYVLFTGRRVRASKPAAGSAAPALGGSQDGRASLYGDGLVRLWLDGSAANGEHAGSHSRLHAGFIRLRRVIIQCPGQVRSAESQVGQKVEPRLREKVLLAEARQEIHQKVRQEERQEISQEVRQEGRAEFGSQERPENLAQQVFRQEECASILFPEESKEGARWPEAVTRSVSSASRGGPGRRRN
jgi:hypothetical protein